MRKIIIDDFSPKLADKKFNAGIKARTDLNNILIDFEKQFWVDSHSAIMQILHGINLAIRCKKRDIILIQYPFYIQNRYYRVLIRNMLKNKNTILFVHDIGALRGEDDLKEIKKEIKVFNCFKVIISHNEKMTEWLKENGCTSKIVNLELFDYLCESKEENESLEKKCVSFAGNLSKAKSAFIYSELFNGQIILNLYGQGLEKNAGNIHSYKGSFPPEKLPSQLNSGFGLVWDGESTNTCSGNYGRYLKYNNPHKCSLYLASGIPVIIWKEAALATFIKKNKLGILIDSIEELADKIEQLSDEEYKQMKYNAEDISKKLQTGYFTKKAVLKAMDLLN